MKNENLYTMEQPELGKKIQELRKLKGLTQEELVEKCNINVRTIQRIEAGEVSPRSFTIKTILEVLGVDSDSFFRKSIHEDHMSEFTSEDHNKLRISWIAGIFFVVFSSISIFVELTTLYDYDFSYDEILIRTILGGVTLTALLFFLRGYQTLGARLGKTTLVYASYIYFAVEAISIGIFLMLTIYDVDSTTTQLTSGVALGMLLGVAELIMGLGIMKLKDEFGSFAQGLGIVKIIFGTMLITVLLSVIAVFMAIPLLVVEVIFLYQAAQKIKA
jgi:transcriptional regulator with XRE-family HTH domain